MNTSDRLIIFLIPPEKLVNGGILSIFSLCKVSREFKDIHKSRVVLATYPGTKSYKKNTLFENDENIYSFDELISKNPPKSLLIHVPEYASNEVFVGLMKYKDYLSKVTRLHINIMNQNILLMKKPSETARWFSFTKNVTQTTAHDKYTTQEMADKYALPTHHFSTFVDPRQYHQVSYDKKKDLIVFSPDPDPAKAAIVKKIMEAFPTYEFVTIQDMKYETYKKVISQAKYTVTFGEGFDGYYVEAFFSDGITFAVYNDDFFPNKNFAGFENTFSSYASMLADITDTMKQLDNKEVYEKNVTKNMHEITKLYGFENYKNNVKKFYLGQYTYKPKSGGKEDLVPGVIDEYEEIINQRDAIISERDKTIKDLQEIIRQKDNLITIRDAHIREIESSHSWKVTKPLRQVVSASKSIKKK
jgi:hypothetical protein